MILLDKQGVFLHGVASLRLPNPTDSIYNMAIRHSPCSAGTYILVSPE
jgi:hypothetical protein